MSDTDFDPNDIGVPAEGTAENDMPSVMDAVSEAVDQHADDEPPEGGGQPDAGGQGGEGGDPPPEGGSELQPMDAPAHWASGDREMFAKQTPEAQKWLMERSNAMEAAHTQRSQEIAPVRNFLDQWNPYFQQLGADPGTAMNTVMQAEYALRTGTPEQKLNVLRQLIQDYGIQAPAQDGDDAPMQDPRVDQLAATVDRLAGHSQQREAQIAEAQMQSANNAIHQFTTAKNEDGTLAHPFFGDVQDEMTNMAQAEMQSGRQPDLKSLYDRACWANPTVRAKMLESQRQAEAKEARRKRNAGSSVSGAGSQRTEQPEGADVRTLVTAAVERQLAAA